MRSAMREFCSTSSTLTFSSRLMATIERAMSWTIFGATPSEGSSSSRSLGFAISARPITSICCSPPLIVPAACAKRSLRRGNRASTSSSDARTPRPSGRVKRRPSSDCRARS